MPREKRKSGEVFATQTPFSRREAVLFCVECRFKKSSWSTIPKVCVYLRRRSAPSIKGVCFCGKSRALSAEKSVIFRTNGGLFAPHRAPSVCASSARARLCGALTTLRPRLHLVAREPAGHAMISRSTPYIYRRHAQIGRQSTHLPHAPSSPSPPPRPPKHGSHGRCPPLPSDSRV